MHSLQLRVIFSLSFQVHLLEHIESGLFPGISGSSSSLRLQGTGKLPTSLIALESIGLAIMSCSNNLTLAIPNQTHERQQLGANANDCSRRLISPIGVYNGNTTVVSCERQRIATRRERNSMNPASRIVKVLSANRVKGQSFSPYTGLWSFIYTLNEA